MLKIKKKITALVILFATFLLTIGFAAFGLKSTTEVAKAATETADIYMKEAASVRVDDPIGIRFSTYVSEEYAESGRSFGTLIIPKTAYSGDITAINENTPNVLDIPQVVWTDSDVTGYKKYTAVLIGIPENFYGVEIYAMSYANNEGVYEFVSNPQSYSVAYIASAALNNGETGEALSAYTNAVAEGITLDVSQATLWDNETLTLTATTQPTGYKAVWKSSNASVATVDKNGVVKGVSYGTATITATFGNYTASCAITVWPYNVGFENGIPTNLIAIKTSATTYAQSNTQASDGNYSLRIKGNSSGYGYVGFSTNYLDKVFADSHVTGLAMDVYSTTTFTDFRYKGIDADGNIDKNIFYDNEGLTAGEWKTIVFPRKAYEDMASLTGNIYQLYFNGGAGMELYVDNMRPIISYTVTYDANGGSVANATTSVTAGEAYTLETPTAAYNFLTFEGWYLNGEKFAQTGTWTLEEDITLTAKWSNVQSFESGVPSSLITTKTSATTYAQSNAQASDGSYSLKITGDSNGYGYVGFNANYLDEVFADENVSGLAMDVYSTTTFTDFRYKGIDASGAINKNIMYDNKGLTAGEWKTIVFPRKAYEDMASLTGNIYQLYFNGGAGMELYVDNMRPIISYTVTYDANGGSVANATTSVTAGEAYTLETPTAAYNFLTFEGWYLNGEKFAQKGTWTLEEDITLTAKWSNVQTFENGVPSSLISAKHSSTSYAQSNAQASEGSYSLLISDSDGYGYIVLNRTYLDSIFADESVSGLAMDIYSTVTFSDFRYRGINASGSEGNIVYDNVGLTAGVWKTIIYPRSAYENLDSLTGTRTTIYFSAGAALSLYVDNMRPIISYTVTYDANGGSVANATTSVTVGEAYTLETPTAAYNFLTFEGWYLNGEKFAQTGTWTLEEDITLTAKWSNVQSFENGVPSSLITVKTSATTYAQSNTKASDGSYSLKITGNGSGYGYVGFNTNYLDNVFADESVIGLAMDVYSTTTFTDFRYKGIDAAGNIDKNIFYDNEGLTAGEWKTIIFPRKAYEDMASLTGNIYQLYFNGGAGMELYVDNMRGVTEIVSNDYKVTYDANGGSVANATTAVTKGAAYALETPTAAYNFLTFEGWYLNGEKFAQKGTWTLEEDITLTAKWSNVQSFESGIPSDLIAAKRSDTTYSQSNAQASNGNYSLRIKGNSSGFGYVTFNTAYLDEVFADENVSGLAMDVYSTTTFTDFRYRGINASGKEDNIVYDNVGLTAGVWKTVVFPRSAYENWGKLTGTLYHLYFNGGAGMELYVDNMRGISEVQYTSFGEIYVTEDDTTTFDVGAVAERVQIDYQSIDFAVSGSSIVLSNADLTAGDHTLVIRLPENVELSATLTVYKLVDATAEMSLTYGSQGYQTLNYANVTRVLSDGMDIPFEYNSGNSSILIADATIVELLPTENGAKVSGTVELVVLTEAGHYLLRITVTVSGTATELSAIDYINDYVFSSSGYTSVEYSTSQNLANLSPEKLLEYKNSGLTVLMPCSEAGVGRAATSIPTQTKTLLENAAVVGLKVVLYDIFLMDLSESTTGSLIGTTYADTAALDAAVWTRLQMYSGYESFYGVALADEPSYNTFTAYGEVYQSIQRVSAAHGIDCYIHCNLLAAFAGYEDLGAGSSFASNSARFNAYKAYLQKFLDVTGADYVMYDLYPLTSAGLTGWGIFTLQAAAEVAKANDVALYVVTQTCTIQSSFFGTDNERVMSIEDLNWINNMLLGFGVKEIHYFTYYARLDSASETYIDEGCFVTFEGEKTDVYYRMQAILAQNQQFASVIKSFDYVSSNLIKGTSVTYNNTGILNNTDSTREYARAEEFDTDSFSGVLTAVSADKEYVLLTTLNDGTNNMYMVQNVVDPQYDVVQTVTMTFTGKTYAVVYENGFKRIVKLNSEGKLTLKLSEGNAAYVMAF